MNVYFSDWFDVDPVALEEYGVFNVSLINEMMSIVALKSLDLYPEEKQQIVSGRMSHGN